MFAVSFMLLLALLGLSSALTEEEHRIAYHARNYTWPIKEFVPNTPGWDKLMRTRLEQVSEIDNLNRRYEGYVQVREK
jgi:hypothetical protein